MFIPGTFHLIFLDHNGPPVTETMESETSDKVGGLLKHAVTLEKLGNTDKQEEKKFQHSINIWYTYPLPSLSECVCAFFLHTHTHTHLKRFVYLYPGSGCLLLFYRVTILLPGFHSVTAV